MRRLYCAAATLGTVLWLAVSVANAGPSIDIKWVDLVPAEFSMDNPLSRMSPAQLANVSDRTPEGAKILQQINEMRKNAPVRQDLDGQTVGLPGYVLPLGVDEERRVTEFFFVPYIGACVHVPPPPANQLIYVVPDHAVPIDRLFQAARVEGRLTTVPYSNDMADAGYRINASVVELLN